jgi:hypothetical protein
MSVSPLHFHCFPQLLGILNWEPTRTQHSQLYLSSVMDCLRSYVKTKDMLGLQHMQMRTHPGVHRQSRTKNT